MLARSIVIMTIFRFPAAPILAGILAGLVQASAAGAQSPSPSPAPGAATTPSPPRDCGTQAALYRETSPKGVKLWVLRRGTMVLPENPLRPLSRDEAVVLEVVVNGRRASAWGPDTNHLRQGAAVQALEREAAEPIRWTSAGEPPGEIRVIAEDGRPLLGPLPFGGCEDAPAAKPVAMPTPKKEPPRKGRKERGEASRPGPSRQLPQGALDGLSLPRGR